MRICLVYDCLYPCTVGGAERWYRALAERLAAAGHEVTYLTRRQWGPEPPLVPGVRVVSVSAGGPLYGADGRRLVRPPLAFGAGVLRHLLRRRRRYDVVHTASFPFFGLLAARLALAGAPTRIVVDWFEVWSREYWEEYLGRLGGRLGHAVQRACVRLTPAAFVFSALHARRLRDEGLRGEPVRLSGLYAGPSEPPPAPAPARPVAVFAGRHIPEKRVPALVAAVAAARRQLPELRCEIYGDGPERSAVLAAIAAAGLEHAVSAPGFVAAPRVDEALRTALCMVLPSRREGYGLVVVEAASRGTPSIVVREPDNAATEMVEDGRNGVIAASASAEDMAAAIVAVHEAGPALRAATAEWFRANAPLLSVEGSLEAVLDRYRGRVAIA